MGLALNFEQHNFLNILYILDSLIQTRPDKSKLMGTKHNFDLFNAAKGVVCMWVVYFLIAFEGRPKMERM